MVTSIVLNSDMQRRAEI